MKWYITEAAPIVDGINTVKIIQKEMGSEAAAIVLKWPYMPTVTRITGQVEVPVYADELDVDGNPVLDEFGFPTQIQTGTAMQDVTERVEWPYLIADGDTLRDATAEERELLDAAAAAKENQITAELVSKIAQTAILFATTLRRYFPDLDPPAEQNHNITEAVITQYFIEQRMSGNMTADMVADSMLLNTLFQTLKQSDGTIWLLPWDDIWATLI